MSRRPDSYREEGSVMCVEWYFTTILNKKRKIVIGFLLIFFYI